MYNIAIVGAGQLGSRHLQSLKSITLGSSLFVIDPNTDSLDTAEKRYEQIEENKNIHSVLFSKDLDNLPHTIDLLIVATSSNIRAEILKLIIQKKEVKNIVLEKVLFQREKDYYEIETLFNDKSINAWVNCPRRMFPVYQKIRDLIEKNEPTHILVDGANWGMACNSIHFIDLVSLLLEEVYYSIDNSLLYEGFIESKRDGFKEVSGLLKVVFQNKSTLTLSSRKDGNDPIYITISNSASRFIIEESKSRLKYSQKETNWDWKEETFEKPLQSQMTSVFSEAILINGNCQLTPYQESMKLHLPFINSLLEFFNSNGLKGDYCPIT